MAKQNPFKKAERGKKFLKLLISGGSGGGKTLTAIQIACHIARALGRPGSVAVIDSEDGSADLYAFDSVVGEPYRCACEQCRKGNGERMPLEFDHVDLRDHSPQEFMAKMRASVENDYAVLVIDSASHEWCGQNGCLEQVDALKGDGRGNKTNNAWNQVTQYHNAFLSDLRAIPIHLIATARTKPGRGDDSGCEIIIQRDKDGPFEYEFGFWGTVNRNAPGTLFVEKSRSGHFQGEVWKSAGKYTAEQFMLWAGHIKQQAPQPNDSPAGGGRAAPVKRSEEARPPQEDPRIAPENCKHTSWSSAEEEGESGASCDDCGMFKADDQPPEDKAAEKKKKAAAKRKATAAKKKATAEAEKKNAPAEGHRTDAAQGAKGPGGGGEPEAPAEAKPDPLAGKREAVAALLFKLPEDIKGPYANELIAVGADAPGLSNLLACAESVAAIAALLPQVDEATATQWKGFVSKAGMDSAKLAKMAPWCQSKVPAPTA